jgi:hypothetical protein
MITFRKRHAKCYDAFTPDGTLFATIFRDTWGWMAQQVGHGTLTYIASGPTLTDTKRYVQCAYDDERSIS